MQHSNFTSRRRFFGMSLLGVGAFSSIAVPKLGFSFAKAKPQSPPPAQDTNAPTQPPPPPSRYASPAFIAFIDTIIPGLESDRTQAPGAIEADTLKYLERVEASQIFPISIDVIHFAVIHTLNTASYLTHFTPFNNLSLAHRQALIEKLLFIPGIPFLLRLVRAPFYTASMNRVGFDYLGYPGANEGYTDYSFGEVLAPPESGTIGGNLP